MSYHPIHDMWIMARPKVKYHGAYPSGFLSRARALLGVGHLDPVLHVCAGKVRDYPFAGFGPRDKTLDLDPALKPDFLMDARGIGMKVHVETKKEEAYPSAHGVFVTSNGRWPAVLADRPYTSEDAAKYAPGADKLPDPHDLLRRCLEIVLPGGKVGFLDYVVPRPPKTGVTFTACVALFCGFGNRIRAFSVFEKRPPQTAAEKERTRRAICGGGAPTPEDCEHGEETGCVITDEDEGVMGDQEMHARADAEAGMLGDDADEIEGNPFA